MLFSFVDQQPLLKKEKKVEYKVPERIQFLKIVLPINSNILEGWIEI
jgi:hypothetical protein